MVRVSIPMFLQILSNFSNQFTRRPMLAKYAPLKRNGLIQRLMLALRSVRFHVMHFQHSVTNYVHRMVLCTQPYRSSKEVDAWSSACTLAPPYKGEHAPPSYSPFVVLIYQIIATRV